MPSTIEAKLWGWEDMGVGGVWGGYIPPPRTFIPPAKTGWGGYGNFFHVVKNFSGETGDLFFFFCSPQANFLGVGGGIYPPQPEVATPPPTEKTCP